MKAAQVIFYHNHPMEKKRIVLAGGGTAGHVTPNIALLPRLRARGYDVSYIGTAHGIERALMAAEQVAYHAVPAGKLRRYLDIRNVTDIVRIKIGFLKSLVIIAKVKPSVCFSKGGFVSCPVVWASWVLRVPVVIHESDLSPGLANRLSLPFASAVCYSFPETAPRLPARASFLTGIPVRETLMRGDAGKGRALCGFIDRKPVILVTGGSQGAQAVNAAVRGALDRLLPEFNVCHLCGRGNMAAGRPGYAQFEYVNQELADLFALADAVVSRAGATTIFELLVLRKPALLIPLPLGASRGDQLQNAASFEKHGWSRVLPQESMTPETLTENIRRVFQNRQTMISSITSSAPANGTEKVIEVIERTIKNCK
ncbi:MAG: undecaprenyldiphospho-muramoylpentapeptide beta-N-acetylglucosaminyltransferase [Chitinispirillaceae bacterium]|nr:undecaprenyldiphospho-muramoylpentapeptide beta-N-acetylglucosaminyltransferase [Chitinispirillaceae bacterium]